MTENIEAIPDMEAENHPKLCEIRFDCLVTMYDSGSKIIAGAGMFSPEKRLKPQWFRSMHTLTLESIRHSDEYTIGRRLKEMLHQLEQHIKRYETGHE